MSILVNFHFKCIIFLLFLPHLSLQPLSIGGNGTDHIALLEFKAKIVSDPQHVMSSWNDSVHFCSWEGIICGRKHKRVTILDLQSSGLVGSLSPYIGNMSFLRRIRLQNNTFHGEISPELGYLSRLQDLHLNNNSFEGKIPLDLSNCSNLQVLNLVNNKLSGNIPFQLSTLSKLTSLFLHANYLNGPISPTIGNLTSLEYLSVAENLLHGTLPDTLGQLKHLSKIQLGPNKFSGIIPPTIYNISTITIFSAFENQFHGRIPSNIGILLPQLRILSIRGNNFIGPIPGTLSNATKLEACDLGMNNFTGEVDVNFGGLHRLRFLSLAGNNLGTEEGDDLNFITSLQNCSHLIDLSFANNSLKGVLPSKFNFSSPLQSLSIGLNQIYGDLPHWLFIPSLTILSVQYNQFTGTIPMEIGNLENIHVLGLDDNRLLGPIPSSIANLSSLIRLELGNNNFNSTLPSNSNWPNILFLNLGENKLFGSIPKQLFSVSTRLVSLDLSQNNFQGTLSFEIGNLFNLNKLYISQNSLIGELPSEIGKCQSLEILTLDGNNFQGTLPSSIVSLRGLQMLDLSANNFSGEIPQYLENFSLEYLNLSFNNFEGEVPIKGVFANVSAIFVDSNNRLCGGIPELKLPRCVNRRPRRRKPNVAIFVTIAIFGTFCLIISSCFFYCKFKKNNKGKPSDDIPLRAFHSLSYDRIRRSTNGFSSENLLGVGSFGSVYKGILEENGAFIAVKVLNLPQPEAAKSFMIECKVLQNVRHRNLLRIITSCSSIDIQGNDFKALVYEYMSNGSLEKWLHPSSEMEQPNLNLLQRMNIAIDIGHALDYLHHGCHKPIIHCDLKPSNILLDDDMIAHIGDFGLAKFLPQQTNSSDSSSLGIRGTVGYTAPEYGFGSEVSTNGDVYSFGILLLEIMTEKKPTDNIFAEDLNLHNFARTALRDNVLEIVDRVLLQGDEGLTNYHHEVECIIGMIKVGISCSIESPQDRMDISDAVNELVSIRKNYLQSIRTMPSKYTRPS